MREWSCSPWRMPGMMLCATTCAQLRSEPVFFGEEHRNCVHARREPHVACACRRTRTRTRTRTDADANAENAEIVEQGRAVYPRAAVVDDGGCQGVEALDLGETVVGHPDEVLVRGR
eukprot:725494-Rhodomonas_salina.1